MPQAKKHAKREPAEDVTPHVQGASPEDVEAANKAAREERLEQQAKTAEADLARARGDNAVGERTYVTDEATGTTYLAAAEGHPLPEWAERMQGKSGGKSNAPARSGPEETA